MDKQFVQDLLIAVERRVSHVRSPGGSVQYFCVFEEEIFCFTCIYYSLHNALAYIYLLYFYYVSEKERRRKNSGSCQIKTTFSSGSGTCSYVVCR